MVEEAYLEEPVVFTQLHRLLPPVVTLVQVCRDASELNQLVPLESLCQRDVIEVVERLDGRSHTLVVFLLYQEVVESFVDGLVVVVLHCAQVRLDEGQLVDLGEDTDGPSVVHARGQYHQEIVEKQGLVVEVELQGLVVELDVGHLRYHVL